MYPSASTLFGFNRPANPSAPTDPLMPRPTPPPTSGYGKGMPGAADPRDLWGSMMAYYQQAPPTYDADMEARARRRVMEDMLARMPQARNQASMLFGFDR